MPWKGYILMNPEREFHLSALCSCGILACDSPKYILSIQHLLLKMHLTWKSFIVFSERVLKIMYHEKNKIWKMRTLIIIFVSNSQKGTLLCLPRSWDSLICIRDSPVLTPLILQLNTIFFVPSSGALPCCLPQNIYVAAILMS